MKIERLEELQQNVSELRPLKLEECVELIGEIWRLKTMQTAKKLDVNYWQDGHALMKAEVDRLIEANRHLQAENDLLKSVHGVPEYDLENRWSNCAVRMRKRRNATTPGSHSNGNQS